MPPSTLRRRSSLALHPIAAALLALVAAAIGSCATAPPAPPPRPPPVEEAPPIVILPAPDQQRIPPPDEAALPQGDDDGADARADADEAAEPDGRAEDRRADDDDGEDRAARPTGAAAGRPASFPDHKTMTVHALDVGQGAATLIETPCGVVLVDTGGEHNERFDGPRALIAQLDAFFARRADLKKTIDLLVITHPHIDHVRGVPAVLDRYDVRRVVDNGRPGDEIVAAEMARLRAHTGALGRRYRAVVHEDVPKAGLADGVVDPLACKPIDPRIRVLAGGRSKDPGWGQDRFGHAYIDNENNHSVAVRVDFGKASVLVTGDLEYKALDDLVERYRGTGLLDVDVYAVGHHGAANGTTQALLEAMSPDVAFIQSGDPRRRVDWSAWQYGHPRQKTVDLLEGEVAKRRAAVDVEVGTGQRRFERVRVERAVYGTGWEGAIVIDLASDGRVHVRPTRRYVDDGAGRPAP